MLLGCDKCTQRGEHSGHHINYPDMDVDLRSDQLLRLWIYSEHHTGVKPLTELIIGMVSSFPLDHMHVCLLQVTRQLTKM